ncbi:hypothetical protein TKWG_14630 [Advenella kashmirensis WT001]|uniref:Uncharacterized protein n=1 Tax=Advenella kashmirensis (strain DSM 17095 / LMG 22695 / WT001) TaxID=1036672 RepID=I3UD92_ADVKW|nr:hypothetical protein TKWG_14630 [Advenella kashmirensis WT001]
MAFLRMTKASIWPCPKGQCLWGNGLGSVACKLALVLGRVVCADPLGSGGRIWSSLQAGQVFMDLRNRQSRDKL